MSRAGLFNSASQGHSRDGTSRVLAVELEKRCGSNPMDASRLSFFLT